MVAGDGEGKSAKSCIAATRPDNHRSGAVEDFKQDVFEGDLAVCAIELKGIGVCPAESVLKVLGFAI